MSSSISETTSLGVTILALASAGKTTAEISSDVSKGSKLGILQRPADVLSITSKSSKVGHGVLSELSMSSTPHLHAMNILGPVGAITALAADTLTLGIRSGKSIQLKKELDELPYESRLLWKRQILEAQSTHADGMVKSSTAGV